MNPTTWTIYREYLDKTGNESAAASLALADALQSTLDGRQGGSPKEAAKTLTPPQAARRLGVHADTVRAWINKGTLKAVNVALTPGVGRPRYRISCEELANFQARQAVTPLPKLPRARPRRSELPAGFVDFLPEHDG